MSDEAQDEADDMLRWYYGGAAPEGDADGAGTGDLVVDRPEVPACGERSSGGV